MPLDLTNGRSVNELAGEIGGKVDIVINNAEVHRTYGIAARRGTDAARAEMDINYFGAAAPGAGVRPGAAGARAPTASAAPPPGSTCCRSMRCRTSRRTAPSRLEGGGVSLAQCLRAEMRPAGIRVVNVFPGPIDDEWNQLLPPPKLAPAALARAIVKALQRRHRRRLSGRRGAGMARRWRDNPKVLERETVASGEHERTVRVHPRSDRCCRRACRGGSIRVVDLTQTLTPEFPQIALPPEMGQCWPFRIEEVSRYDERGPGWYWNNFSCGEHTGTHFDAPIHWISGRDLPNNAVDTIPAAALRRAGLRDRLLGAGRAPTPTTCSPSTDMRDLGGARTAASRRLAGC